jgi:hypothetical protein
MKKRQISIKFITVLLFAAFYLSGCISLGAAEISETEKYHHIPL